MFKVIAGIGLVQVCAILVNLGRSKVLAVWLGPHGVGVVSVIDQVVQFAAYLSAFSLPAASVKFLSRAHSEGPEAFQRTYAGFLAVLLGGAALGTAVLTGIALFLPSWLGANLGGWGGAIAVAACSIPAMSLLGFFTNVFAAARKTRISAAMALVANAALTAGACAGLMLGSVRGLYVGTALMNVLLVAGTLVYLRLRMGLPLRVPRGALLGGIRANRDVAPFAFFLYIATSAYSVTLLIARTTLLEGDGTAAGLLQALLAVSGAIALALNPANGLYLTPLMNRRMPGGDKMNAALEFHKKLLLLLGCGGVAMVLFPDLLLRVLFSSAFAGAAPFLFWFVLAQCVLQLAGVYQAVLIGLDDLMLYAGVTCTGYIAVAVLCKVLAPRHGIAGVGYAFFAGSLVLLAFALARLKRRFGMSVPPALHAMTLYVLAGIAGIGAVFSYNNAGGPGAILVRVAAGLCFACTLLLWLNRDERNSLQLLWRKLLPA